MSIANKKYVAVILEDVERDFQLSETSLEANTFSMTSKIALIYIQKEKWFAVNDPLTVLSSTNTLNKQDKLNKKNVIIYLESIEDKLKKINSNIQICKIVIIGTEKYKIKRCLRTLNIQMVVFLQKKKNILYNFFGKSLFNYVYEDLDIPVLLLKTSSLPE